MGWPHNAYVGQKVVCVDDSFTNNLDYKEILVGNIYIIREICIFDNFICFKLLEILKRHLLEGYFSSDDDKGEDCPFDARRFRPVQSTDKGMEVLKGLLNPINHKVLEDA